LAKDAIVGRRAAARTDDRRCLAARRERNLAAHAHRAFIECSDAASERVHDMGLDPLDRRLIEIAVPQTGGISREALSEPDCGEFRRIRRSRVLGDRSAHKQGQRASARRCFQELSPPHIDPLLD
jgi:hypothetical protein